MTKLIARSFASILFGVLALGSIAQAQRPERTVKANIPFDFALGSRTFPAGHYSLVRVEPSLLELRDSDGRILLNILTHSVQSLAAPTHPRLLFDLNAGEHTLTEVWQENDTTGQRILQSGSATRAVQKRSAHVQTAEVGNPR